MNAQTTAVEADEDLGQVFRATISIDVYLRAKTEAAARAELAEMDIDRIAYEANEGSYVAGTKQIGAVTQIADDRLDNEMESVGSSGDFFRI